MRVLHLIASNGFYGAESVILQLASHHSSHLAPYGWQPVIGLFHADRSPLCSPDRSPDHGLLQAAQASGIPTFHLACRGRFDPMAILRLARFLRSQPVDLLHTHGYKANLYGLPAARMARCPVVATCHNWTDRTQSLRYYATLDRLVLRLFQNVVAVSPGVYAALIDAGLRPSHLRIIPNGVDTAHFGTACIAMVNSRTINSHAQPASSKPLRIGAVTRLSTEKGLDVLLRALAAVFARYPAAHCVIAGEGPQRRQLVALAHTLGIAQQVSFPGFCADTRDFLQSCTVFAHPSRLDGMPMAVLEAMAAGKPIVASHVGSIPMLLRQQAGLLVPPDDPAALSQQLLRLLGSPALRMQLGRNAQLRAAQHFSAASMAAAYAQLYREQLDCSTRSSVLSGLTSIP